MAKEVKTNKALKDDSASKPLARKKSDKGATAEELKLKASKAKKDAAKGAKKSAAKSTKKTAKKSSK